MKSLKTALFAVCFGLVTAPAPAQDAGSADSELPSAYLQGLSGRYVGGAAGNTTTYGLGAANPGLSAGAGDWHPMESFRMELEYAYRDRDSALLTAPSVDGAIGSLGTMAKARVNLKVTDWLTPYVGIGMGWTRTEAERLAMGYTDARAENFAYQGMVGLSVPVGGSFSFFADGRYVRGSEANFAATDDFATHGTAQTWSALAGVRFTFGK
ncbi:outer membrane beta-barrel protein [Niveispirillum sp.]|uniref:outer membrane protein n=1 Tax=Niveispirillum sp. TaxID=1917217 RepID=UPI001B6807B9|nr:outer membrane beta-barrel protein [Niveispirillum sp.]MBP7338307.1 porin family protein [Niveispirillum sp.]